MQIKPYERTAFYYETDQMGIIHHSNYIRWLEEARKRLHPLRESSLPLPMKLQERKTAGERRLPLLSTVLWIGIGIWLN